MVMALGPRQVPQGRRSMYQEGRFLLLNSSSCIQPPPQQTTFDLKALITWNRLQ